MKRSAPAGRSLADPETPRLDGRLPRWMARRGSIVPGGRPAALGASAPRGSALLCGGLSARSAGPAQLAATPGSASEEWARARGAVASAAVLALAGPVVGEPARALRVVGGGGGPCVLGGRMAVFEEPPPSLSSNGGAESEDGWPVVARLGASQVLPVLGP